MRRGSVGIALGCLLPLLVGCGSGQISTYHIKGKVLVDGQPAKDVQVAFHPKGTGDQSAYFPSGKTDEKGEFALSTLTTGDGAPAGQYDVTIVWPIRYNPISTRWEGDKLKGKYKDKSKPFTTVTVEPKDQELEPFNLKMSGSAK